MPDLIFPINPDGLSLDVMVGLDQNASLQLLATSQSLPRPFFVRGLIDTGCDVTAVSPHVLARLGATPGQLVSTITASGAVQTPTYYISLSIPAAGTGSPQLVVPTLFVTELVAALPDHDVLIGMNVLRQYKLTIDGPLGQFTLTF